MKRIAILLMGVLFVSSTIIAQTGTIQGIVKDKETGEPVPFASVYIEVGGVKTGAVTDFDGKYTIKPVITGAHTVHVSNVEYNKKEITDVQVTSGQIAFVNADMSINTLTEVVIERDRYEIPLINHGEPSVQQISRKDFKHNVNRLNPIKVVTDLPGLTLAPNGKDVYIRGARPSSTQFITDGMKSTRGEIGIPGLAVGSIKVYTGGIPAQYGDLTGGVIIVETKSYFDLAQEYNR